MNKTTLAIGIITAGLIVALLLSGCTPQPELPYDACKEACKNLSMNQTCGWEWQSQYNITNYCTLNQSTGNTTQWENKTSEECWCFLECPDGNKTFYTKN